MREQKYSFDASIYGDHPESKYDGERCSCCFLGHRQSMREHSTNQMNHDLQVSWFHKATQQEQELWWKRHVPQPKGSLRKR